ncbi:hypothetical protein NC651_038169 [Populus alba x Populus x berolinensis]|nr:hypothetical protein NC651_038169 [Populus alba x Populus x berolinensis]
MIKVMFFHCQGLQSGETCRRHDFPSPNMKVASPFQSRESRLSQKKKKKKKKQEEEEEESLADCPS